MKTRLHEGERDADALGRVATDHLNARGWKVDYIAVRRQRDLKAPTTDDMHGGEPLVVLSAAKLGVTRLIDNLEL